VIVVVFLTTALPIISVNRYYADKISDMERRLEILKRSAQIGNRLRPKLQQMQRSQMGDADYLSSTSEALAAAELQRILKQIVVARGGDILSTQIMPTVSEQGFSRITLKAKVKAPLGSLVAAFYDIEAGRPYLFIDELAIRARSSLAIRRARRLRTRPGTLASALDVDFQLSGYIRGGGS
jgi:general secretion pathway protein M